MRFFNHLADLERNRATFAVATVVARRSPASSQVGDRAVIYADGRMDGLVGGSFARDYVRREALRAIGTGRPSLLQIRSGSGNDELPESTGVRRVTVSAGGPIDVFIQPHLPARLLAVAGNTPVAEALALIAAATRDYDVLRAVTDEESREIDPQPGISIITLSHLEPYLVALEPADRARFIAIIASQGSYDEDALETFLAFHPAFLGLLASRDRAADVFGVLAERGIADGMLASVRHPVGLDIGAKSAAQIAISILAQIVKETPHAAEHVAEAEVAADSGTMAGHATDPVCGMEVKVLSAPSYMEYGGETYYFCSAACRSAFVADPDVFLALADLTGATPTVAAGLKLSDD